MLDEGAGSVEPAEGEATWPSSAVDPTAIENSEDMPAEQVATSVPPTSHESESDEEESDEARETSIEMLARKLQEMREAGQLPAYLMDPEEAPRVKLMRTFDEAGLAEYMLRGSGRDIVVLGGAGMSTSAGIPDFRSPGTGLYDNLQKYDLPRPQAIFEIDYFRERPYAFYELARELWPGAYAPTPTHAFIKLLDDHGRLLRCFTQNIDSLESAAGVPYERCVAAHGNFDSATCIDTGEKVPIEEVKQALLGSNDGWRTLRDKYGGLVKPDIVFFGEGLPPRFFELARRDLAECKLLLVIGTSLSVQPFASLVNAVSDDCARVLINRDAVGLRDRRIPAAIAAQLNIGGGFEFHDPDRNYRDVALLGNCDDKVYSLARALGWADALDALVEAQNSAPRERVGQMLNREASSATIVPLSQNNDEEEDILAQNVPTRGVAKSMTHVEPMDEDVPYRRRSNEEHQTAAVEDLPTSAYP